MGLFNSPLQFQSRKICKSKQWRRGIRKSRERKERMERVKADMEEISGGQKCIKQGQEQIRQKFEEIESECHKLKAETLSIAKQSERNQIRLNLMFGILKARQDSNFVQAHHLTQLLREEMGSKLSGNREIN